MTKTTLWVVCAGFLLIGSNQRIGAEQLDTIALVLRHASGKLNPFLFDIEIENKGNQPLILNLGNQSANGKTQQLNAISLDVTNSHGSLLHLQPIDAGVAIGRIDPLVMPLPPHSQLTVQVDLHDYNLPSENVWAARVGAGRHNLVAEYRGTGVPPSSASSDMKGLALMSYWIGSVRSKPIAFTASDSAFRRIR